LFIRPLLLEQVGDFTLFDYIPLEFRGKPFCYVSHAWDGWLKQALFLPDHVIRDWPADAAVWMDIFALHQVETLPRGIMTEEIRNIVVQIANTLLILPGDGLPSFALLPGFRSWCLFEIAFTPVNCINYRMGMHGDLGDAEFVSCLALFFSLFAFNVAGEKRALITTIPSKHQQHEKILATIPKVGSFCFFLLQSDFFYR